MQTLGTAMGTKTEPTCLPLTLADLEENVYEITEKNTATI